MSLLRLTLGCTNYDRTRAVYDGRAPIEGVDIVPIALAPEEVFHRAFKFEEFDITELSLSSHTLMTARGDSAYVGIPVIVSRVFRHSGIYIRTDRGIRRPEDLVGKTIGVPEYQMTANVWIRGILQDDYGVRPEDVNWVRGGLEEPGRGERAPLTLPPSIKLRQIPDDKTLSQMLADGEIDAIITARAPSVFRRGAANVDRLFPDYRKVEEDYFRRTGIFPPMHIIGIRKTLVEQHPWLPVSVYKSFVRAREIALDELEEIAYYFVMLPWALDDYKKAREIMPNDYWSYGLESNRKTMETFTRYHHEQGISSHRVKPEELFAASTLELAKV